MVADPAPYPSDEATMAAIQDGNTDLLGVLFGRYSRKAFALCYRLVGDSAVADDLVQEAFLRVLRYGSGFRGEARFSTWLYRIVRNVCMDHLRASSRATDAASLLAAEADDFDPAPALDDGRLSLLRSALDRLDADKRELLVLCRIEGLAYRQIAVKLGVSEGALRVRVHRALAELRTLVAALEEGEP